MGRPLGSKNNPFKAALQAELRDADGNLTKLRQIAARLIEKALDGDLAAIKEVANRTDGKPVQTIAEVNGDRDENMDLSRLSDEQLVALDDIYKTLEGASSDHQVMIGED